MLFALLLAATHTSPPPVTVDVPLAAPTPRLQAPPRHKKVPPPAPLSVVVKRTELPLLVGIKGGALFLSPGALSIGGFAGVEVAYRLPFANRFLGIGTEVWAAGLSGSLATPLGHEKASAFVLGVPLWVSGNVSLGPGLLRVMAGPQFDYIDAHLSLAALHDNQSGVGLAFAFAAAYLFTLGPGALGLEARYSYLPYGAATVVYSANAFFVALDYSFLL